MVINVTVVGPFEEEEERTGVASDVVKVKGEDPATPGQWYRHGTGPGTVTIPQYRVIKTKQHTQDDDVHTESRIYCCKQLDTTSRFGLSS